MPPESPTSTNVKDIRSEGFDSSKAINGGMTSKLSTLASAKEYYMEPRSTTNGPVSNEQGGSPSSCEPTGQSEKVEYEKDLFIPEVPRGSIASSGQIRHVDNLTSVLQAEKVVTRPSTLSFVNYLEMNSIGFSLFM